MHLRLTEQELAVLIEMVSLASNIASFNQRPGSDEGVSAFESVESKVLERAREAGFGANVEFDEEKQLFRLTEEFENQSFYQECYNEFRNECFWEELVIRLADRDLIRVIGMKAWEQLDENGRREHTRDIEKRYWEEFTKNGVDRVAVIYPPFEG